MGVARSSAHPRWCGFQRWTGARGIALRRPGRLVRSLAVAASAGAVVAACTVPPPPPPPPPTDDPVLAAAGDVACDPLDPSNFLGSLGIGDRCRQQSVSDLVVNDTQVTHAIVLGDLQYELGQIGTGTTYDQSWGRFKSRTRPAIGNHEYSVSPDAYFAYWGPAAGDPSKGYYSYDVGTWHVIVLNSNCDRVGGCGAGSPQEQWLRVDLAANASKDCTIAAFHHPRFSSGSHGDDPAMGAFWQALYEHDADVVLNGHDHDYERFAPQSPSGTADPSQGLREFVVGTGGKENRGFPGTARPNSEARGGEALGVLKLTLHDGSYDWRFEPITGMTYTDSGTGSCH